MKPQKALVVLSPIIVLLALVAAGTGALWQAPWEPAPPHPDFTTLRGDTVQLWGGTGLYKLDSVSGASQEIAQDIVTLLIGIPLLIVASIFAARGSLRGKVLLSGTLGYFLYTYSAMTMLTTYNEFFLLYVALMSLSLFAFVLSLMSIDLGTLPAHFTDRFPRRTVAGFAVFLGVMLLLLWLRLIVPPLLSGEGASTAPAGLDSYTTLVIQAMDLGLIAPTAILTGVLLFRRSAWGYLLSCVVLVLGMTMGAALLAMSVGQVLAGVSVDPVGIALFAALSLTDMALTVLLFRGISDTPLTEVEQAAPKQTTRHPLPTHI